MKKTREYNLPRWDHFRFGGHVNAALDNILFIEEAPDDLFAPWRRTVRLVRNRAHDISLHPLSKALATQQNNNSLSLSYGLLQGISVSYLLLVTITRLQCFLLDHPMGQVWDRSNP